MKTNLKKIADDLENGNINSKELVENLLARIKKHDSSINSFIEIDSAKLLADAEASDLRRKAGKPKSQYDGIPVGIKDNISIKGQKLECASKVLEGYTSLYDATVIVKLKDKGLLPFGRLNMDEFAMGSSTETSAFGPTLNPHDLTRIPGGSSGGSAAAVAAEFVPVALGSDTGGSIRQPASFCGVSGFKPTYGSVSRYGLVAFASSFDQIGPIATNVEDCEVLYEILAGKDEKDSTSSKMVASKDFELTIENVKIAIPKKLIEQCSDNVKDSFYHTIEKLKSEGLKDSQIKDVDFDIQNYATPIYYILATSEASTNLARFDGIRYGKNIKVNSLNEQYEKTRSQGFGKEVKRRLLLGTFALSSGYYDAYYGKAQKARRLILNKYKKILSDTDFLLMPTSPVEPFKLGEKMSNPIEMYLADIFTVSVSLAGLPALSTNSVFTKLPIGIQVIGDHFSDYKVLHMGKIIENCITTPAWEFS